MLLPQYLLDVIECGTDEAGRGCLAGPVTAAAVILPQDFNNPVLNDSKKLTHKQITKNAIKAAVDQYNKFWRKKKRKKKNGK